MHPHHDWIVVAHDGTHLAVRRHGRWDEARPTVLAMHGYPDDQRMWESVAYLLVEQDDVNVVTYDMRGFGDSGDTRARGHHLDVLTNDLRSVIATLQGTRIHLLATDSGSITAWHAVCRPWAADLVDSFTSVSGPHLAHAREFLLRAPWRDRVRQLLGSWYIGPMMVPGLVRLGVRVGLVRRIVATLDDEHVYRDDRTLRAGWSFYRQNFPRWLLRRSPTPTTSIPVQLLAPVDDQFVTAAVQWWGLRHASSSSFETVPGGHWAPRTHPEEIAYRASRWVRQHTTADAETPASRPAS